jgi:hypothetical protein
VSIICRLCQHALQALQNQDRSELKIADCRLQIHGLAIADCRLELPIADWDCRLSIGIADCRLGLPIVDWDCRLLIAECRFVNHQCNRQWPMQSSIGNVSRQSAVDNP